MSGCPCVQQSAVHHRLDGDNLGCSLLALPLAVHCLFEKSIILSDGATMRLPCSTKLSYLPFANDRAALREQQMTSSNGIKENAIFVEERGM